MSRLIFAMNSAFTHDILTLFLVATSAKLEFSLDIGSQTQGSSVDTLHRHAHSVWDAHSEKEDETTADTFDGESTALFEKNEPYFDDVIDDLASSKSNRIWRYKGCLMFKQPINLLLSPPAQNIGVIKIE